MYNDLKDKVAIITGSSSGIGKAIAERFAKEGMKVVINYFHHKEDAEKLAQEINNKNSEAILVYADVKKEDDIKNLLAQALDKFGKLDVWVNNAGTQKPFPSHELPLDEWQSVIDTNLTSVFLGSRTALEYFISKNIKGSIINISSIHQKVPWAQYVHYAASKGGIKLLTETLALEYGKKGIRVNAIAPGGIDTPINEKNMEDPRQKEEDEKMIPLGYIGYPEEIANVAAWLASNESSYVTGATIFADGGLSLHPTINNID